MTRKDYEAFAEMIRDTKQEEVMDANSPEGANILDSLTDKMCAFFKRDNPRFSESKFREACY